MVIQNQTKNDRAPTQKTNMHIKADEPISGLSPDFEYNTNNKLKSQILD